MNIERSSLEDISTLTSRVRHPRFMEAKPVTAEGASPAKPHPPSQAPPDAARVKPYLVRKNNSSYIDYAHLQITHLPRSRTITKALMEENGI